jgi:hypothetical protein
MVGFNDVDAADAVNEIDQAAIVDGHDCMAVSAASADVARRYAELRGYKGSETVGAGRGQPASRLR